MSLLFLCAWLEQKLGHDIEWNTRLVACDGIHSSVRAKLGLHCEGEDYTGMVLQNMDVDLAG